MTYPKPLSPRTIARKYSESGMTGDQIDFLHEFFLAAARLYGVTRVGDLWVIYKELGRHQKVVEVRRRDMLTFSAIARRENLPYRIYELNEVYEADEPSELQRMVISKDILSKGYYGFSDVYDIDYSQVNVPYYIPSNFLQYGQECIVTKEEWELEHTLENLRCATGKQKGKKLGRISIMIEPIRVMTEILSEKVQKGHRRCQKELDIWLAEGRKKTSVQVMDVLRRQVQRPFLGHRMIIEDFFKSLDRLGVHLSEKQAQELIHLLIDYLNAEPLHMNRGWPASLMHAAQQGPARALPEISFGPGLQKSIEEGTIDGEKLKEMAEKMGFTVH